jgi:hypothetical protein
MKKKHTNSHKTVLCYYSFITAKISVHSLDRMFMCSSDAMFMQVKIFYLTMLSVAQTI